MSSKAHPETGRTPHVGQSPTCRAPNDFFCSLDDAGDHARSRIGIVFEQRLVVPVVFSSLVLDNRDLLNLIDPDD